MKIKRFWRPAGQQARAEKSLKQWLTMTKQAASESRTRRFR
jgi:hypothetical protein